MIDPISYNPSEQPITMRKKNPSLIIMIIIILVLVSGFYIIKQSNKIKETKTTVAENKEPSPTEKPKIDKKSVKIQVLNGTGTPGQAGVAVEVLKKAGYNPDNIKTANADEFNNTITTIATKDGFADVASDIKDALKTTFDEIKIDSTLLDKDSEFDIVITTGGKKFEEATPTPTLNPTSSPTSAATTPTSTPTLTPTSTPTPTP
ncbi:MAG: LytR C-terminal domain-containing protein [Candidatus Roizmanbacteria bacterium]